LVIFRSFFRWQRLWAARAYTPPDYTNSADNSPSPLNELGDMGEIAMALIVVKPVTDYKHIRYLGAEVFDINIRLLR
jgi:hypothetical protein